MRWFDFAAGLNSSRVMITFLLRLNGSTEEWLELSTHSTYLNDLWLVCFNMFLLLFLFIYFFYCHLYSLIKQTVSTLLSLDSTSLYGGLWSVVVKFGCFNKKLLNPYRIVLRGSAEQFRHHGTSLVTDQFLSIQVWVGVTDRVMSLCARWSHTSLPPPNPWNLILLGHKRPLLRPLSSPPFSNFLPLAII